jgi:mRNA interferase RelE/StbE
VHKIEVIHSAQKDLDNLEKKYFVQIINKINSLKSNPRPANCLKLTAEEGYRLRSGNYRVLYRIDDKNKIVYIYRVRHRKESYNH